MNKLKQLNLNKTKIFLLFLIFINYAFKFQTKEFKDKIY